MPSPKLQRINRAMEEEPEWALTEARKLGADRKELRGVVALPGEIRKRLGLQLEIVRASYDPKARRRLSEPAVHSRPVRPREGPA